MISKRYAHLYSEHHWSLAPYLAQIRWIKKPRLLDQWGKPLIWYATWADARTALIARSRDEIVKAEAGLARAKSALKSAEKRVEKILTMEPQFEPGFELK